MQSRVWAIGLLGLAGAVVACVRYTPPAEDGLARQATLVRCDKGSGRDTTKTFSPNRTDTLELDGHMLIIPAGALSKETEFRMKELSTSLIKVRVWGGKNIFGWKEGFKFNPGTHATLAVSYDRCGNEGEIAQKPLAVYRLKSNDSEDTRPYEPAPRPSTHYPDQRQVRASLSHSSGYGIGQIVAD